MVTMAMMIVAWVTGSVLTSKSNFMTLERIIYLSKRNGAEIRARWGDDAGDGVGGDLQREKGSTGTIGR